MHIIMTGSFFHIIGLKDSVKIALKLLKSFATN